MNDVRALRKGSCGSSLGRQSGDGRTNKPTDGPAEGQTDRPTDSEADKQSDKESEMQQERLWPLLQRRISVVGLPGAIACLLAG